MRDAAGASTRSSSVNAVARACATATSRSSPARRYGQPGLERSHPKQNEWTKSDFVVTLEVEAGVTDEPPSAALPLPAACCTPLNSSHAVLLDTDDQGGQSVDPQQVHQEAR